MIGVAFDTYPQREPYLWLMLTSFLEADPAETNLLLKFITTMAEIGANFDWTNQAGDDIVKFARNHPDRFNAIDEIDLALWIPILEEARNISRAVRASKGMNSKKDKKNKIK